jgi:ABC-type branched-subunit amino acid transport system substrate-binding protein
MQCPRCGYPSDDTAATCIRCGLLLPSSYSPFAPSPQSHPLQEMSQTIDGVWREDDGTEGRIGELPSGDGGDGPPSWLMKALRDSAGAPDSTSVPLQGGYGTEPPLFSLPPASHSQELPFLATPDASLLPDFPGAPPMIPPGGALVVAPGTAMQRGQPSIGTSLKGGRYRLVQAFYGTAPHQPPGNEPPLIIASDAELPNGRVLIQEVLLNAVRPEDSENARRMIAQRLLKLRSHPAMPRLVDHFSEQWRHFLVFELPSGDLLADRLQRVHGPMPEALAIRLGLQIIEALEVFEQQVPPFIHGDLSPASIILRPSGQVVIIGCSPHLLLYPSGIVDHPPAGGFSGYAAPEQARGQASPRSDIFALCAILHHAVTGVAPTPRSAALHPPARHLNPDVSLELEEVLSQGMRPSGIQRYQRAADLKSALERMVSGRVTHVPDELRDEGVRAAALVPARDARGRLVLPRQRRLQSPLFLFGILLSLIVLIGGTVLFETAPRTRATGPVATPNGMSQLVQQQDIGLSGGEFAFDTGRPDTGYKIQGSTYLASGDLAAARASFLQAVSVDPTDAEAAIFAEDLQISVQRSPFITVVVGTAFDPTGDPYDIAASRSELQGIYMAQKRINSAHLLPDGVKLRVEVLNSGLESTGATIAADALVAEIKAVNAQHLVGVIGWPEVTQTQLARSELKSTGLPLITPTASDDTMTNFGASLFRLVPLDSVQAQELADVAVKVMHVTSVVVVSDPKDALSSSMANSFTTRVLDDQTSPINEYTAAYTSNISTDFTSIAQEAVSHDRANLIYFSTGKQGGDVDTINLAKAVISTSQADGVPPPRILVDSRAYTPALLGLGTSQDVDPISKVMYTGGIINSAIYSDLYVESLANVQEWSAMKLSSALSDAFDEQFSTLYDTNLSPDELTGPNATIILSYDALDMLVAASSSSVEKTGTHVVYPTLTEIRDGILAFTPSHPFIGMSGAISYDLSGNVNGDIPNSDNGPGRAFAIMQLVPFAKPLSDGQLASAQVAYVAGGFCGQETTCTLSRI